MRRSDSLNATYDGVVRLPWSFAMISTRSFCHTPTHLVGGERSERRVRMDRFLRGSGIGVALRIRGPEVDAHGLSFDGGRHFLLEGRKFLCLGRGGRRREGRREREGGGGRGGEREREATWYTCVGEFYIYG